MDRFLGEPRIPVPYVPPALPVLADGLNACCIMLIARDGLDPSEGDALHCPKCLTWMVFGDGLWQWDITSFPPPLPLPVPPPGVPVEDPPGGSVAAVEPSGGVEAPEPGKPVPPFKPAPVPWPIQDGLVPDQQE